MYKQVIIIRTDLNMRKGKMVSQGSHSVMKLVFDRIHRVYGVRSPILLEQDEYLSIIKFTKAMLDWLEWEEGQPGFTKIVVGCDSEEELLDLERQAKEAGIINAIIKDNGATEFKQDCPNCKGIAGISLYAESPMDTVIKCNICYDTGKVNKPTYTCLAIGPDDVEKINKITGHLKLL